MMKDPTHPARLRFAAFLTCFILLASLMIALIFSFNTAKNDAESVYTSVFRLHIRANSNSAQDQETKLAVRDALLPFTAELFADCGGLSDAVAVATHESEAILSHINSTLSDLGADYSARISVGREEFPERDYGGALYPAGEYTALIVELGTGEGDNWWCVLFPSLCLKPAEKETAIEAGITPEQFASIAPAEESAPEPAKYTLKFRFFELLRGLFED